MEKFKYKSVFAGNITKISSNELNSYISDASLEKLTSLMPKDVNLNINKDLIGVVANCAVAGQRNLNGDSISNKTAINIAKNFIHKYVNISHSKELIKGCIVNYGFSKFGSNDVLNEDEASNLKEPFNISLAFLLWKTSLNDEFIQLLEKSVDNRSDKFQSLSCSWELLFAQYDIAVGSDNVNKADIISDENKKQELEKYLLSNGGIGKRGEDFIYRVIKGETENDFLIPSGIGLVSHPAANVKGLEIVTSDKKLDNLKESDKLNKSNKPNKSNKSNNSREFIEEKRVISVIPKIHGDFTGKQNSVIKDNKENIKENIRDNIMPKITKISDINDETLKEIKASSIVEFIDTKIKEENAKFLEEQGKAEKAEKSLAETQKELKEIKESLQKLQNEALAKAAQDTFNQRMAYFDDTYELSADERKAIAEDISVDKNIDEESFNKVKSKYDIFLKDKNKEAIAAKKKAKEKSSEKTGEKPGDKKNDKEPDDDMDDTEAKKCKASENGKDDTVLEDALKNGKDANAKIPNGSEPEKSFAEKWAEAWKPENCVEITRK